MMNVASPPAAAAASAQRVPPELILTVMNAEEAAQACVALERTLGDLGGAEALSRVIIDIKHPTRGSLGRPDESTVDEIVEVVAGRFLLSVAWGEVTEFQSGPPAHWRGKVDYLKLGLAGVASQPDWPLTLARALAQLQRISPTVLAIYADWRAVAAPAPSEVTLFAQHLRCRGVLIDTCDKSAGPLWQHGSADEVRGWIQAIQSAGMRAALAGSLFATDLPTAADLGCDLVAFRSALCTGGRDSSLSAVAAAAIIERWWRLGASNSPPSPH